MSYIPDCRQEFKVKYNGEITDEPNGYYEGNLNNENKQIIKEYDLFVDEALNMFSNIDIYDLELEDIFDMDNVDTNVVTDYIQNDKGIESLSDQTKETQLVAAFAECMAMHLEMYRNNLIVSLMDNQEE